jgi:DNA polymerase-3 subunit epsilon
VPATTSAPINFAAIDFETADDGRDSACSVGIVVVRNGKIVERVHRLIRPPRKAFIFTSVHGISWKDVQREPVFGDVWKDLVGVIDGVDFLAAHSAHFDRSVLATCCDAADIALPAQQFLCTVRVARSVWDVYPTTLPAVCEHLDLTLKHHDALSDAEACANIVLAGAKATSAVRVLEVGKVGSRGPR